MYRTIDKNVAASGLLTTESGGWSLGCAEGKKCGFWSNTPYQLMWNGNTIDPTAGDSDGLYKDRYSSVLIDLRVKFNSSKIDFFTASNRDPSDSCVVYGVDTASGYAGNIAHQNKASALCEYPPCPEGQERVGKQCLDKCPDGYKRNANTNECTDCAEEYEKVGTKCLPACKEHQHRDANNECICDNWYEADDQGICKESCPTDRQCGDTCCGEGNICVGGNQCCNKVAYEEYQDDSQCCPASESTGFDSNMWECCSLEQTTYTTDEHGTTQCCSGSLYKNAGYNNATLCCDHEPETYQDNDFKVCWAPETECKTNADCETLGDNYFCNLKNETDWSCYYPTSGTCQPITTDDYTDANVEGLGSVRKSKDTMTWWAAENWCKAQGKSLIDVSKFNCYYSGTNNPISTDNGYGHCCKGNNQTCNSWYSYWNGNTIKNGSETTVNNSYSPVLVNLRKAFESGYLWTASDYSSTDSCHAFAMALGGGDVSNYSHNDNGIYALCEYPPCPEGQERDDNGVCCDSNKLARYQDTTTCCTGILEPKGSAGWQICCHPNQAKIQGACGCANPQTNESCGTNKVWDDTTCECVCEEGYESDGQGGCRVGCPDGLGRNTDDSCTVCTAENEMYLEYKGGCTVVDTTDLQCRSNMDCNDYTQQLCQITGYGASYLPNAASCQDLDQLAMTSSLLRMGGSIVPDIHVIRSTNKMRWETAYNWCLAKGGRMASLTDFGVTACDSTGKALDMCGTTDVWAQLNNNWSSWTDFYNHWITSVVQQDWSFLSTSFCWMKESYSNRSMYTFRPSTGTVSQAARDEQSNYALCIIPDVH